MKNRKMENDKYIPEITNSDKIFGRLLSRPMFPWKENKTMIGEKLSESTRVSAIQTVVKLNQNNNLGANQVIEKVKKRAISWSYDKELDHTRLWETSL